MQQGMIRTDTRPESLLKAAKGHVWTVTTEQHTATYLQTQYLITAMVRHQNGIQLRIVSASRPHEDAAEVEPNLEDAYLMTVQTKEVPLTATY